METKIENIKRALIYTRVSTEEQAEDHHQSLGAQKSICFKAIESMEYILAENGLYSDPGKSATTMNRPALQDMLLRVVEDKNISAIFVQDTDRLARNVTDHLAIKALLRKNGVDLISVSQPGIKDDPEGRMMDLIVAGFNQFQSDITSRKTMKSLEEKFNSGCWPTKAPLGYLNASDTYDTDKRVIQLDQTRAHLIKEMFELYSTGDYSIVEIRDIAYKKGLLTQKGKKIATSKMFKLIRCTFYYGLMCWRGLKKMGTHVPIISKTTYDQCQRVLAFNNRYASRKRKHNFLLRGFIFCNTCMQRYTASFFPKKNKAYYHATLSENHKKCSEKYIEAEDLEEQIQSCFNGMSFTPRLIDKVTNKIQELYVKQKEEIDHERKVVMTQKVEHEKKLEVAEEKLISGVLGDSAFNRIKNKVLPQIALFDEELYRIDCKRNMKMDVIQEVLSLVRDVGGTFKEADPQKKRLYLSLFWDEFRVADKKVVFAQKSPIVLALEAVGSISVEMLNKPLESGYFGLNRNSVRFDSILGG